MSPAAANPDLAQDPERAAGLTLVAWCLGVAASAVLVLCVFGPLFEPDRLHVQDMYVDQVGYVTTARILADTGELRNGVLFPSLLDRPDAYVHMPGHSATLALAYLVLGFGVLPSLLPSLVSFVLAAVLTFAIGNRLAGRSTGALAALIFVLFPANVAYAFTAMAELTFTLASVAAIAIFVHLPRRRRWGATPLLLVLPFLFRESGAFLIVPLALVILRESGLARATAATFGSVLSLWLVNRWQIASGKLPASLAWVTEGGFNYGDAFATPQPELSASEWLAALARNVERNLGILAEAFDTSPGELMPWCLYALFAVAAVALLGGAWSKGVPDARRSAFALGAGLLMLLVFALSIALYDVKLHKLMRSAMFTLPFGAIGLACGVRIDRAVVALRSAPLRTRWIARIAASLTLAAACVASHAVARLAGEAMTRFDALGDLFVARLETFHDDDRVLVSGIEGATYAVAHYPVVWCILPANEPTLARLVNELPVGAVVTGSLIPKALLDRHSLALLHTERLDLPGAPLPAGFRSDPIRFYGPRRADDGL